MHKNQKDAPQGHDGTEGNSSKKVKLPAPAFQFYARDWLSDSELSQVSLQARGLWIEMLARMWVSPNRGHLMLTASTTPPTTDQLARACRCSPSEMRTTLAELEAAGIFSRTTTGIIFSRRMLRDMAKRAQEAAWGRRGGNPFFEKPLPGDRKKVKGVNPRVKGGLTLNRPRGFNPKQVSSLHLHLQMQRSPPTPPAGGAAQKVLSLEQGVSRVGGTVRLSPRPITKEGFSRELSEPPALPGLRPHPARRS